MVKEVCHDGVPVACYTATNASNWIDILARIQPLSRSCLDPVQLRSKETHTDLSCPDKDPDSSVREAWRDDARPLRHCLDAARENTSGSSPVGASRS